MPASEKPERQPNDTGDTGRAASAVNVERLADRVYRMMLAELRLERARSGKEQ
jgi:hypothetical protein